MRANLAHDFARFELAHVTRVASPVTAEARLGALLHDVVERSSITVEDLIVRRASRDEG